MLFDILFTAAMLLAAAIDCRRRIIPDWLTVGGMAAAPVFSGSGWEESIIGMAAGLGSGLLLRHGGGRLFRKRIEQEGKNNPEVDCAFGMGDVKLMGLVGAALGWRGLLFTYMLAAAAGAAAGLCLRKKTVPFGPFVAFAAILRRFL